MATPCSSSMAFFLGFNFNSAPLTAATSRPRQLCSSRTPIYRAIQSELGEVGEGKERPFVYTRAKPEVRWPHKSDEFHQQRIARESGNAGRVSSRLLPDWEELSRSDARVGGVEEGEDDVARAGQTSLARRLEREEMIRKRETFRQRQKGQVRRLQSMSKLALRKATDLQNRARRLSTAICVVELSRPVANVLDGWPEQLNNDEMSVVVRNVGDQNWRRALELYEWLNLRKWYTPNPRLLATILHILGRANQLEAARELFLNAEPELTSCIQVFNAILGVYAKQGQWQAAQHILELIALRGCEPDIITFNTIANARCKYDLQPGMASALLKEIESAGLRPDIITYNTLVAGCISKKNFTEATEIVKEMEQRGFDLNACTSYVLGKKYLKIDDGEEPFLSVLNKTLEQQASSNNDVQSFSDDDAVQQAIASTENLQEFGETSSDSLNNSNRKQKKPLNISDRESKEVSTPHFVAERGYAENSQLFYCREHVFEGKLEEIVKHIYYNSEFKLDTPIRGCFSRQTEGVLKELCRQAEYLRHLFNRGIVHKECDSPKPGSFYMRIIEAEMEHFFSVQGIDHIVLKERSILRKFFLVWHHASQFRFEVIHLIVTTMYEVILKRVIYSENFSWLIEFLPLVRLKDVLELQRNCWSRNFVNKSLLKTITPVVEGIMRKYFMSKTNFMKSPGLQSDNPPQMFTPYTCSLEAAGRPGDILTFSMICLFMQWKTGHVVSSAVQGMQSLRFGQVVGSKRLGSRKLMPCRIHRAGWILGDLYHALTMEFYKEPYLCKAAQAPLPDTEEANHMLSDVGQLDIELVQVATHRTLKDSLETPNALGYAKLLNECMIKKDYSCGLEHLKEMIDAGIEPGYMTWICVLQACGQCVNRVDLLRLLAALRDAGCPLPLRLIMERDAAMAEVECWLRNLQATAADAGQGMVNVLVDILWAFKLCATSGHLYDLAVRLDIYPRNFARVEEQNWEADFRSLSPGAALVALNHWFIEMQKASLDGFPEPPKEVLLITGTQGYQNGVSLNKTLRAHLWEMGSPFYMRPPREGALITKGHALRLWLKDSPRCFNLDLEDSLILPKVNSMSFFKGAWMSSQAVPVMTQIHTSIGEVWPRRYSKLAHMSETRRIEALADRIENEQRRRLEKRDKPIKKKRPLRRKK